MVGSTGRRKHMRRLQHVPYSLGCMLMDTLMLTWLSTRFEATAHSAVRGKELGEVECHDWQHHAVVVDIPRSTASREGQNDLRGRRHVHISRQERRLSSADPGKDLLKSWGIFLGTLRGP